MNDQPSLPLVSQRALVSLSARLGNGVVVGDFSIVRGTESADGTTTIGDGCEIGNYALIEEGVRIGDRCQIDSYCRICTGTVIGSDTRILYGAAVFEDARIGNRCIIGSDVADRTLIEDAVTYFGEIAHDYRVAGDLDAWDAVSRPSPIIRKRSVIGQNALLVGGIEIGEGAYVAAGEIVRCNVPPGMMLAHRKLLKLADFKGLIRARSDK